MRASPTRHLLLAATGGLLGLGGCSDPSGEAFLGTYTITSHRYNNLPGSTVTCADPGPAVTNGALYIALVVDTFFDDPDFIRLQQCDTPATCTDELVLFTPGGPGLLEESASTQTSGGVTSCGLYAGRATAALTGDVVRVEVRAWADFNDLPASACTIPRAEDLRDTDMCREVEVWEATRL